MMHNQEEMYARRANQAMTFLCAARSDVSREVRRDVLYVWCASLAEERMPVFRRMDERCLFYVEALDKVSDAIWWSRYDVREAKQRLAGFYRLLDDVVNENLVVKRT